MHESIARLDDDVVGEDDAEAIVNSASTRMTDLLVAEVKAQLLVGRMDGVRALLEVAAASDVASRRWSMAFRPLRPLLRTEAAELEPLLPAEDDPRFGDAELYLSRLKTLKTRWGALDPSGQLGLAEVGDEAVLKACEALTHMETYTAVDRLKPLYATAMSLSAADSLRERIATIVTRLNGYEHYTCHFCKSREMDLQRSIVILGKRESHRTYGFNSTTIHYMIKANTVARCAVLRPSRLHLGCRQHNARSTGSRRRGRVRILDLEEAVRRQRGATGVHHHGGNHGGGGLGGWHPCPLDGRDFGHSQGRAKILEGQGSQAASGDADGGLLDHDRLSPQRFPGIQG